MTDDAVTAAGEAPNQPPRQAKSLTIGAVCKGLQQEFPDISISKIRYLEDQKLLTPRRTPGGYRLYSQTDVSRLRTILRLQRDEFLPLRVIRQELAAGRSEGEPGERSWTQVLGTRGGRGVRADFHSVEESYEQHYVFEQTIEGTPFERFLHRARTEIDLDPQNGDTQVTMSLDRRMRGLSRLGSPMMRRAIGRTLNEALDGLETAATGAEG